MLKKFLVNIPDEPYKDSFALNKNCQVTYFGPSFLVLGVSTKDNKVKGIDGAFESMEEIDLATFIDDDTYFVILNAFDHPFEAAYLSYQYNNDEQESYKETLPTGEVYEYFYEKDGILDNIYVNLDLYYDPTKQKYSTPRLLSLPIPEETYRETIKNKIKILEKALADNPTWTEDEKSQVNHAINWYKNMWTMYPNTDFFKIPIPKFNLPDF